MKLLFFIIQCFTITQVMALPLIYSTSDHLFHDHEKEKLIYYIPKSGSLKLDATGVPMFNMAWWTPEKTGPVDGELIGTFELRESESQTNDLAYYKERGYEVRVLNYTQTNIIGERYYIGQVHFPTFIDPLKPFEIKADTAFSQSIVDGHLKYGSGFTSGLFEFWYRVEGITSFLNATVTFQDAMISARLKDEYGRTNGYQIDKLKIMSLVRKMMKEKLITFKKEKGSTDHVEMMIKRSILERFFQVHKNARVGKELYQYTGFLSNEPTMTLALYGRYNITEDMRILLSTEEAAKRPELFNKI